MSFPTSVNSQITDAVTQANVKVVGEAPAIAIGTLYQSIAQSVGIAMQDAVTAQRQADTIAIAATAEGISLLLTAESTASAAARNEALAAAPKDAGAIDAQFQQSAAALNGAATAQASIGPQIEAAVELANASTLQNAGAFAYALRTASDAAVAAIDEAGRATTRRLIRTLQSAAVAACMDAMLRHPEKADDYAKVLQTIRDLA
jgi:Killing trait